MIMTDEKNKEYSHLIRMADLYEIEADDLEAEMENIRSNAQGFRARAALILSQAEADVAAIHASLSDLCVSTKVGGE